MPKGRRHIAAPPPSASPTNSAEASARLDTLINDKEWSGKFLAGDVAARQEYSELMRLKLASDKVDAVIAGTAVPQAFETVMKGELTTRTLMGAVADLHDIGISNETIKQIFDGRKVSTQEVALTEQLKRRRMSDASWVSRYLAGGQTERREMTLIGIILTADVEDAA